MELSVSEVIHAATHHLSTRYGRHRAGEIQDAARAAIDAHVARHADLAAALTQPEPDQIGAVACAPPA